MKKTLLLTFAAIAFLSFVYWLSLPSGLDDTGGRRSSVHDSRRDSERGRLVFDIRDRSTGEPIPAKMVFLHNGEEIDLQARFLRGKGVSRWNVLYSSTGEGSVSIPAGEYEVRIGRGFEYSMSVQRVSVHSSQTAYLKADLTREVDTEGYIAADMHLHTATYSKHGDAAPKERLIAAAAEGLEWIVMTEHHRQVDFAPLVESLHLSSRLKVSVGNEISMTLGHMNVYPLRSPGDNLSAWLKKFVHSGDFQLFKLLMTQPEAYIKQLNHPRSKTAGYFDTIELDSYFADSPMPDWGLQFDAVEVINGGHTGSWNPYRQGFHAVMGDWFNLLNRGLRLTAVGNSDSHSILPVVNGMPRNYIASSTGVLEALSEAELVNSIRQHKVVVSRGLFIDFTAESGVSVGGKVAARDNRVVFHIRVQAPQWIDCDSVYVIENGDVAARFAAERPEAVVKFDRRVGFQPQRDSWYLVIATGKQPLAPFMASDGPPIRPLAFTNPIWVDAEADGRWMPLRESLARQLQQQGPEINLEAMVKQFARKPYFLNVLLALVKTHFPRRYEALLTALLPKATPNTRLLVYRELQQLGTQEAQKHLFRALDAASTPLELLTLVRLLKRTGTSEALDAVKKRLNLSDGELTYLYNRYLDYTSSTRLAKWLRTGPLPARPASLQAGTAAEASSPSARSLQWISFQPPEDGLVRFEPDTAHGQKTHFYFSAQFYSQQTGNLKFFYVTNSRIAVLLNQQKQVVLDRRGKKEPGIHAGVFSVPVRFGKNHLFVEVESDAAPVVFSIEPVDTANWINPAMRRTRRITHLAQNKSIRVLTEPSPLYPVGSEALIDGRYGSLNPKDGHWFGIEREDFEAVLDLGRTETIHRIAVRFMQHPGKWAFLPVFVEFSISKDGDTFEQLGFIDHKVPLNTQEPLIKAFALACKNTRARYIRILAKNIGICPDWHPGAGSGAFLLIDEIQVR